MFALTPPPFYDPALQLEVAVLGGAWNIWPLRESQVVLLGIPGWQRTDFLQFRLIRGEQMCAWIQVAPCEPAPDEGRDRSLIAEYLDPRTFLMWLRSLLADEPVHSGGGDWDGETNEAVNETRDTATALEMGLLPTVEEILRAWARSSSAFTTADEKVNSYFDELRQRAKEQRDVSGLDLLHTFERTWNTLTSELR